MRGDSTGYLGTTFTLNSQRRTDMLTKADRSTMSAHPSLNAASTPFIPGGGAFNQEDGDKGFGAALRRLSSRERFGTSISTHSISPSDYRSVKSSPSPPQTGGTESRLDQTSEYQSPAELSRHSPANVVQLDTDRGSFMIQRPMLRESSMSAIPEMSPDGEETPGPHTNGSYQQNMLYSSIMGRARDRLSTPPVTTEPNSRSSSFTSAHNHLMSSSPASSLDSGSIFTSSLDQPPSFDAQMRAAPAMRELLDRFDTHERALRELHRALQDVDRKVNLLVERVVAQATSSPPEFSNPFASNTPASFPPTNMNGLNGPRGSIVGNIAPNQAAPQDDISMISNRLNSLTTSVDQLLAIQTQQAQNGSVLTQSPQLNDMLTVRGLIPSSNPPMGLGIPGRTGPRLPVPPSRTWSTGTLDLPMRSSEQLSGPLGRIDPGLRDKRRSVSGLLRRDSTAVRHPTISMLSCAYSRQYRLWIQYLLHQPEMEVPLSRSGSNYLWPLNCCAL